MPDAAPISLDIADRVARLRFERAEKRNALTLAMWEAIPRLLAEAQARPDVRLLIVEGAGGVFSAGADIAEFAHVYETRAAALENHALMQRAMAALEAFPAPTLAAIEGPCIGGGCGIALCTDLRYADPSARFGITPGKLGLVYGVSDTRRLVQAVGHAAAKDILFTGRIMTAEEASAIGLVDRLVASGGMAEACAAFGAALVSASGATARATKQILAMLRAGAADDTDASRSMFADAFEGADFREGFAAFLEKRQPRFN